MKTAPSFRPTAPGEARVHARRRGGGVLRPAPPDFPAIHLDAEHQRLGKLAGIGAVVDAAEARQPPGTDRQLDDDFTLGVGSEAGRERLPRQAERGFGHGHACLELAPALGDAGDLRLASAGIFGCRYRREHRFQVQAGVPHFLGFNDAGMVQRVHDVCFH